MAFLKPQLGIRGQILIIAIIPFVMATTVLIVVIYRGNILQVNEALARQGNLLTAQLAASLEYPLSTAAIEQISRTVASVTTPATELMQMPIHSVQVLDRHNQIVFSEPIADSPKEENTLQTLLTFFTSTKDLRTFSAPVYLDPLAVVTEKPKQRRLLGTVTVTILLTPLKHKQFTSFLLELGLVFSAVAFAVALALWQGQRIVRAIEEVAQAIMRIKQGERNLSIKKTRPAELGTLQEGVNLLSQAISTSQQRLEDALAEVSAQYEKALTELTVQTEKAESANQVKSQFLANVSHDLRTPLYTIQALTEQSLKESNIDAEKTDLEHIQIATQTLLDIIDEILNFMQLEDGHYSPSIVSFNPREELNKITETLAVQAQQKGLSINASISDRIPQAVRGDRNAFRAIANNLLANAVAFTQRGYIHVRLTLAESPAETEVCLLLEIEDTGCGIAEQQLEKIFQPFEQIDSGLGRRSSGRGLGLAIVRSYCQRLLGQVTVASQLGQGSVFSVWLPFQRVSTGVENRASQHPENTATLDESSHAWNETTILVVEDFAINREIMVRQLRNHGFQVIEAADADQAIFMARQPNVDLILMDIQMPGKDGLTAIRELRQYEATRHLTIIGFTASADKPTHRRVIEAGADSVLVKPMGEIDLITAVRTALEEDA